VKRTHRGILVWAVTVTVFAATTGAWPTPSFGQQADDTAAVDPDATAALDQMGAYLRTLKALQVEVVTAEEVVLDNGLKVEFGGVTKMVARKPDRLRVSVSSDLRERQFFYDGKQLTLWAPRVQFYATVPAPPTIGELASALEDKYGMEFPLVDLFRWGTSSASIAAITAAVDIGPSTINDTTCEHYAFRQEGLDWQIWIQKGDYPLPRKLVLTTTTDEARPQFAATYTWNLAPSFNDAAFTFNPPADAHRIVLADVSLESGGSN